jgi:DNA-binding MarR family transcriptional regulator
VGEWGSSVIDTGAERPIGYWLKKLDRLIDGQFERELGDGGVSRRQWQVLNLLQDGPRSAPELQAELEPFVQEAPDELDDAVTGLLSRGWVDSQDAVINLTETGEAQLGLVTAKIAELRQDLAAGISPEEYRTTIDVLVRMVANLESDARSG